LADLIDPSWAYSFAYSCPRWPTLAATTQMPPSPANSSSQTDSIVRHT